MTEGAFVAVGKIKGGVGATSLAVTLAVAMRRAGRAVALLDADPQLSATRWLERFDPEFPSVAVEAGEDPRGATIEAARQALELAPFVVADPPPSALDVLRVLVSVADLLVVPSGPALEEVHLARRTLEIAAQEATLRRRKVRAVIVPTRIDPQTRIGRDALDVLADLGFPVAPTLSHRVAWPEAMSAGVPIFDAPRAAEAIREARAVCDFILEHLTA